MMPKQCSALAYCPPESKFATDYTGMLIFLLVDLLLLVWHVWTWWRRKQLLAKERTIVRTISFEHVLTTPTTATNEVATDYLMDLLAGYYRAFVAPLSSNASGAPAIAGESTTKLTSNLASTSSHGTDMSRFPRMNFSFEELRYDLPDGKTILKGVSGHIRSGRLTCVMGPSGSGKVWSLCVEM